MCDRKIVKCSFSAVSSAIFGRRHYAERSRWDLNCASPLSCGKACVVSNSITYLTDYLLANFRGLVLGGFEAIFRNQILVGKLLTRSIRFTFLWTFGIPSRKIPEKKPPAKSKRLCRNNIQGKETPKIRPKSAEASIAALRPQKFITMSSQIVVILFDWIILNEKSLPLFFAILIRILAETSPIFVGISQIIQKMLQNAENICIIAKNGQELDSSCIRFI